MSSASASLCEKNRSKDNLPKVSCLTVTADRKQLMKRAVKCFQDQTYKNKELVVIDDGHQNLDELLKPLPADQVKYIKLDKKATNTLGKLRNRSLQEASGDFLIQWDDDDWYHSERIAIQAEKLMKGYDSCCLSGALVHLNEEPYRQHPFTGSLPDGIPGSIMHRKNAVIRYPNVRRGEDTVYLRKWTSKNYCQLSEDYSYLFIRCYHGANTWEKDHFLRRTRNNPKDAVLYFWHKIIRGDLFDHPRFELTKTQRKAFTTFLEDSRKLNLFSTNHR